MLKMVDGTGIIGVDMICPLGVSTPQPPNYDRVELDGAGMLALPNSLDAPLERLELGGKTKQVQTTGDQLFDKNSVVNGVIIADGTVTDNAPLYATSDYIPVKPSVTYACTETGSKRLKFFDADKQPVQNINFEDANVERGGTLTTGETTSFIRLSLLREKLDSITLNEGSKSIPYEPYTGGKPSPSPEYPQEIKSVGKWNEETRKYEVSVKVTGKNLLNTYEKGEKDSEYYSVNEDGSLNQKKTDNRSFLTVPATLFLKAGKYYFTLFNSGITFQLYDADANAVLLVIEKQESVLVDLKKDTNIKYKVYNSSGTANNVRVMVSTNKEVDYVPCKEPQSLTITSDRPITKWDKLVEQGGQIGWLYKSAVVKNFNGDGYKIQSAGNIGNVNKYIIVFPDALIEGKASADIYVDRYRGIIASYAKEEYGICCNWNGGIKYFNAPNKTVKTVDDFKKWLTENPLTIAYETESTEFIPLPQSEQNAIRALTTYYPTTVITVDGGELDPDIKVTYRKEI